jgi:hypothetical protein
LLSSRRSAHFPPSTVDLFFTFPLFTEEKCFPLNHTREFSACFRAASNCCSQNNVSIRRTWVTWAKNIRDWLSALEIPSG